MRRNPFLVRAIDVSIQLLILNNNASKYGQIPIPDAAVTLNQSDLIAAATAEKTALLERLRNYLGETSRTKLLEKKAQESEYLQKDLAAVPYTIYIG